MSTATLKVSIWSKTDPLSSPDTIRIECGIDEDCSNLIKKPATV
ncbi:hypothetical protein [Chitinophaga sancti]